MAEYKKDYYTRTFIDMLSTLELELVQYEDGIGISDAFDEESDFVERFDTAVDVVDYISGEIDDGIRGQFEDAVRGYGLEDEWRSDCLLRVASCDAGTVTLQHPVADESFSYEAMLAFIDKHEDFKDEWAFLIYEPTAMLLEHLDDVDIDLAMELTNELSMDYSKVFEEMLDVMEFELVKYDDGFGVVDLQGGNLGDIESDRFDDAQSLIDRLDIYLNDYYFTDLDEAWEAEGFEGDIPETAEDWVGFMNEHKSFKEEYRHEYDVMNMIAYRCGDVSFDKCFEKERSVEKSEHKDKTLYERG